MDITDYPQVVIESILSSVKNYENKAQVLMKMLVNLIQTEHQIIPHSDRDNLGNKSYLTFAEIIKRDLTMNNGWRLTEPNKVYEPGTTVGKGDSNVYETLSITKPFKSISEMITLSTPMSSLSHNENARGVNSSHTGYKCPFDTPSGGNIGLCHKNGADLLYL